MAVPADIKLICLDLDGTAAEHDGQHAWLADAVVDALNALGQRGVRWCANSGRSFDNQLGLIQACRRLVNMPIAILSGERFIHWLAPQMRPHEPFNGRMRTRLEQMYPRVRATLEPHRERLRRSYAIRSEQDIDLIIGWNLESASQATQIAAGLRELLAPVPEAQILQNVTWVIITHRAAGKGVVLAETGRALRVGRENILAIGDHLNDLDMLDGRAAAHVGCPADADDEVKAVVRAAGGVVAGEAGVVGTAEILRNLPR